MLFFTAFSPDCLPAAAAPASCPAVPLVAGLRTGAGPEVQVRLLLLNRLVERLAESGQVDVVTLEEVTPLVQYPLEVDMS